MATTPDSDELPEFLKTLGLKPKPKTEKEEKLSSSLKELERLNQKIK